MQRITNILAKKKPHFHTVRGNTHVHDAISQMNCENIDYLIVVDEHTNFMGILSEHELASKLASGEMPLSTTKVSEIMNTRLPMATVSNSVEQCMQLMKQHHSKYLVVFDQFVFCGVVSADDIIDEAVNNRQSIFDSEPV